MVGSWVFADNLIPTLEMVAHVVGYEFDSSDRVAIEFGLSGTDADEGMWFEYPFVGSTPIELRIARSDPGSSVIHVVVPELGRDDEIRIGAILDVFNNYIVNARPLPDWQDP